MFVGKYKMITWGNIRMVMSCTLTTTMSIRADKDNDLSIVFEVRLDSILCKHDNYFTRPCQQMKFIYWFTEWLSTCLSVWPIDRLSYWLKDRWLPSCWLIDRLTDWKTDWYDGLNEWVLTDWFLFTTLVQWSTDRLSYWILNECVF